MEIQRAARHDGPGDDDRRLGRPRRPRRRARRSRSTRPRRRRRSSASSTPPPSQPAPRPSRTPASRSASTPSRCARPTPPATWTTRPPSYTWTIQSASARNCGTQQTLAANDDAWIDQGSPSANKGSDSILKVMSKSGGNLRALVRFDLPTLPQGCSVERRPSASSPPRRGRPDDPGVPARRLLDGGRRHLGEPAGDDRRAVTTTSGTGWREWNVAGSVRRCTRPANNGFLIRDANENQDAEQQFHSREKGTTARSSCCSSGAARRLRRRGAARTRRLRHEHHRQPVGATTGTAATFTFAGVDNVTPWQPDVPVPARRPRDVVVDGLHEPADVHGSRRGLAHLPRARRRRRLNVDPTPGRLHLDDRPDGAGDGHQQRAGRDDDEHERDRSVHVARARRRRSSASSTRARSPPARRRRRTPAWRRPAHLPGARRSTPPATRTDPRRATRGRSRGGRRQLRLGPDDVGGRRLLDRAEQPVEQQGLRLDPQGHVEERERQPARSRPVQPAGDPGGLRPRRGDAAPVLRAPPPRASGRSRPSA